MDLIANTFNTQPLAKHLVAVGMVAYEVMKTLLPNKPGLQQAALWSGLLHDVGKADPYFQDYLKNKIEKGEVYLPEHGEQDEENTLILAHQQWSYVIAQQDHIQDFLRKAMGLREEGLYGVSETDPLEACLFSILFHHSYPEDVNVLSDTELKEIPVEYKQAFIENINTLFDEMKLSMAVGSRMFRAKEMYSHSDVRFFDLNTSRPTDSFHRNADFHLVKSALIWSDRVVSSLDVVELARLIDSAQYSHFVENRILSTLDDTGLRDDIAGYRDAFKSLRSDKQNEIARNLYIGKKPILAAAPATGKTRMALMTYLTMPKEQPLGGIIWVCPRVAVCEGVLEELSEALPNSKISINTGSHKASYIGGKPEAEFNLDSSDIIVTTIDYLCSGMLAHGKVDNLKAVLNRFVVFDEFHEFFGITEILPVFMSLTAMLKEAEGDYAFKRFLLMSGSPLADFMRFAHREFHAIASDELIVRHESHNNAILKLETTVREDVPVVQKNTLVILNNSKDFIGAYLGGLDSGDYQPDVDHIYHSQLTLKDRSERHKTILSQFGKNNLSDAILVSGPAAQAALNISRKYGFIELSTPENTLQRAGRVNRFAEYEDSKINVIALASKLHKLSYTGEVDDKGRDLNGLFFIALEAMQASTSRYNDLYDLYFDFYSADIRLCKAMKALKHPELKGKKESEIQWWIKKSIENKWTNSIHSSKQALEAKNFFRPKKFMRENGGSTQISFRGDSNIATVRVEDISLGETSALLPNTILAYEDLRAFDKDCLINVDIRNLDVDDSEVTKLTLTRFDDFSQPGLREKYKNRVKYGKSGLSVFQRLSYASRNPLSPDFLPLVLSNEHDGEYRYLTSNSYAIGLQRNTDND